MSVCLIIQQRPLRSAELTVTIWGLWDGAAGQSACWTSLTTLVQSLELTVKGEWAHKYCALISIHVYTDIYTHTAHLIK